MESRNPKVFVSHASEDKERFVIDFAKKLRASGVDAWIDKWEMLPGDSLIDKIFEEGIKSASAFIIVLSANSVKKPWVREEINAAFVKRVSGACKIIPVLLDECEVPECLSSTLWQRISDLTSYEEEFKRITNAVFGMTDKPPLGDPPAHTNDQPQIGLPELNRIDNLVFTTLCEESIRETSRMVTNMSCLDPLVESGISKSEVVDSLQVLGAEGYLHLSRVFGGYLGSTISHVEITLHRFDEFARQKWSEYGTKLDELAAGIVNKNWHSAVDVSQLSVDERLADHLVEMLEANDLIAVSRHFGGYSIWKVSPKLKRMLE